MNLRHRVDKPFDVQDLLSAVCHCFTSNHFYKLMQRRVHDKLRVRSKSYREDSETLVQQMTDVFASTGPVTTTRTLGKREAATPLLQSDWRTKPGEHPFQNSEPSAVALRERDFAYEDAGIFHHILGPSYSTSSFIHTASGYSRILPQTSGLRNFLSLRPSAPSLTSAHQCQDHFHRLHLSIGQSIPDNVRGSGFR